jgi:hypothetical protein
MNPDYTLISVCIKSKPNRYNDNTTRYNAPLIGIVAKIGIVTSIFMYRIQHEK